MIQQGNIFNKEKQTYKLKFLLLRIQRNIETLEVFLVKRTLLHHLDNLDFLIRTLLLKTLDESPQPNNLL